MHNILSVDEYAPRAPRDLDMERYGIGLIGCGGIANGAHLPAYKKAGFRVVACCDVSEENARSTAEKWNIPFWTTNVSELLERTDVKIVDMALHPPVRLQVMKEIAKAPRPVLVQKPLHFDLRSAQEIAGVAKQAGIKLAVNQQARWNPANKAMKVLVDKGLIGEVYHIGHFMRSFQDQADAWYTSVSHFNILDHGIHYLDLCRLYASSPAAGGRDWSRLSCTTAMLNDQSAIDPMIYTAAIEFGEVGGRESLMASMHFNNIVRASGSHKFTWWLDGTEGSIWQDGSLFFSRAKDPGNIIEIPIEGTWFPDAFIGPMSDLITAVEENREPAVTPVDNFQTVAMTSAMVKSSQEGRVIEKSEMMQELIGGQEA